VQSYASDLTFYVSVICSNDMLWDYFIHVCKGPPSFAIFNLGYTACFFNFVFVSDVLRNVSNFL